MTDTPSNRYVVIDKQTEAVVVKGLRTRQDARIAKRELEFKHRAENSHHAMPSRYYVETDVDHPAGVGLYYH